MYEHVRALMKRHLPGYESRSVTRLGEGMDNVAYEINGELVLRLAKDADRNETVAREAELLRALAVASTLPVPEPIFADPDHGALCYVKLPGVPLLDHQVADPTRLAAPLGEFLTRLHEASTAQLANLVPRDSDPPPVWRDEAEQDYRDIPNRAANIPVSDRRRIEEFLARTPPYPR